MTSILQVEENIVSFEAFERHLKYSVYYHIRQRKSAKPHIGGAGVRECLSFYLKKKTKNCLTMSALHTAGVTRQSFGVENI